MIHPSYYELIDQVNKNMGGSEEDPIITSRYSIVIAAARRARQLIDISAAKEAREAKEKSKSDSDMARRPIKQVHYTETRVPDAVHKKPLSIAVEELMNGDVRIIPDTEDEDEELDEFTDEEFSESESADKNVYSW